MPNSHGWTNASKPSQSLRKHCAIIRLWDARFQQKSQTYHRWINKDQRSTTSLSSILTRLEHQVESYDSRSTMPQDQRYSQIEIESAAIKFGVTNKHIYLYGSPEFTTIMNHKLFLLNISKRATT